MCKNKICSLIVTFVVALSVFGGNVYSMDKISAAKKSIKNDTDIGFVYEKKKLPLTKEKKKYIIVTKNKKMADNISEEFKETKQSEYSTITKEKNIVSVKMTGKEANEVLNDVNVLCVEPDVTVTGCSEEITSEKITEENQSTWNHEMLHVPEVKEGGTGKVKVAILDSGIDYGNDISYKEQINLIPGEEELTPFFTDATGHGTSVAGIIAAEDNETGITGVNPNVLLYSAKVLSDGNKAPVSRVIEGIYWAIENKVNIINMSFSTPDDSQILRKAVEDAYHAGILMIAAAGNNGQVEYPAAYPQVVAVGSVNAEGEAAEKSASGEELELVAPGEKITSTGLLHGTIVESGTSLAAPHVTGVASLLWQKDVNVSADFIRGLLNQSANPCGDTEAYGEGLIDYEYALNIYDRYKEEYDAGQNDSIDDIPENPNAVPVFEENNAVEGQWSDHDKIAKDAGAVLKFQQGAAAPDKASSGLQKLGTHHPWHGGRYANYAADYRYVVKVANAVDSLAAGVKKDKIVDKIMSVDEMDGMNGSHILYDHSHMSSYKGDGVYIQMQKELCNNIAPVLEGMSPDEKRAYVFGLASHIATDAFSHASYRYAEFGWEYIDHIMDDNGKMISDPDHPDYWRHADNTNCVNRRYRSANAVLDKIIDRFKGNRSNIAMVRDFLVAKTTVAGANRDYYNTQSIKYTKGTQNKDATYRLHKMGTYLKTAGESDSEVLKVYQDVSYN